MSDDLSEDVYRMMETTIDQLGYVVPTNAKVYIASYGEIFTPEAEVTRGGVKYKLSKSNGSFTFKPDDKDITITNKPGAKVELPGIKGTVFMRYAFQAEQKPLGQATFDIVEDGDKQRTVTTIPRGTFEHTEKLTRVYLLTEARYADLIYDTAAEMNACGFSWGREVAKLTEEFRRDLFEKNLHEQKDMPQLPINGRQWIQQLAKYGTYDSDGNYFNKWKAGKAGPHRVYTDKYLEFTKANRQEILLKQGPIYIFVKGDDLSGVLYSIELDSNGLAKSLTPHRMQKGLIWEIPSFKQNSMRNFDIYFIATGEGAKEENKASRGKIYHLKDGDQASHTVIDPRKLVAAALGDEVTKNLGLQEDDEWGWFTQMCAALFQEPYYQLDMNEAAATNTWVHQFGADNLVKKSREFMEKAWKEQGPDDGKPITRAARERVRKMSENKNVLVLPQGFPSSKTTRFIGTDGHYAFDRDIETGMVYVMPNYEYIGALAQGEFYAQLYDDLAWLIPMMEFTAYLAAIAVAGWAMGAREVVVKQATKKAGKEAVKQAIKAVRPALIAVLVDAMLDLVTKPVMKLLQKLDESDGHTEYDWAASQDYVERWQEFLRGFFDGYIVLNLEGRVAKLQDILMPDEAKAVLIVSRLYELVQKFRDFLERIEGVLTDGAIAKILFNLNKSATHIVRGVAQGIGLLYYLPHDKVKPLLELFSSDEKAPDPDHWAQEAQEFFKSVSDTIEGALGGASDGVESLRDILDIGGTKPIAIGVAVGLGYSSFLTKTMGLWKHTNKVYAGLALLAIGFIVYEGGGDEMLNVGVELAKEVGRMFPGKDKKAAKLNGQLIGKLVGTFLVDKALFGEKSSLGKRLKARPVLKVAVEGSVGGGLVGSIFKVVFSRYIDLAQRIGEKVKFVHDDLKHFVDEEKAKKADLDGKNMPNLKVFHAKSDEVLSFREFVEIMVHLKDLMIKDRDAFQASVTAGVHEVRSDFAALNRLTKAAAHLDLEKLKDDELRALMIQMNAQAANALHEMLVGIDYLFAEIGGEESIMSVLNELGIDTGDLNKAQQAVHKAIEPKMAGFKKAEERLEQEQAKADAGGDQKKAIEPAPVNP